VELARNPSVQLIPPHAFDVECMYPDGALPPVLTKIKSTTWPIWTYVPDDQPEVACADQSSVLRRKPILDLIYCGFETRK
jgi:hypothetical protein